MLAPVSWPRRADIGGIGPPLLGHRSGRHRCSVRQQHSWGCPTEGQAHGWQTARRVPARGHASASAWPGIGRHPDQSPDRGSISRPGRPPSESHARIGNGRYRTRVPIRFPCKRGHSARYRARAARARRGDPPPVTSVARSATTGTGGWGRGAAIAAVPRCPRRRYPPGTDGGATRGAISARWCPADGPGCGERSRPLLLLVLVKGVSLLVGPLWLHSEPGVLPANG